MISHKSKKLYLAGFQVFNALIDYLVEHTELKGADQVILIGSSGKSDLSNKSYSWGPQVSQINQTSHTYRVIR